MKTALSWNPHKQETMAFIHISTKNPSTTVIRRTTCQQAQPGMYSMHRLEQQAP